MKAPGIYRETARLRWTHTAETITHRSWSEKVQTYNAEVKYQGAGGRVFTSRKKMFNDTVQGFNFSDVKIYIDRKQSKAFFPLAFL